jgi:Beta protein
MIMGQHFYVPSLRWRQGEYQALFRLSEAAKDRVTPFLTIPPVEFDFELWAPKKSVHEHVAPFALRYKKKWKTRPAWIDVDKSLLASRMNDGKDVFTYVFDGLREFNATAVPAIALDADAALIASVAAIVSDDGRGVAVRVRLEDLMKQKPGERIAELLSTLGVGQDETDLIVDLGAPNYEPYDAFTGALTLALGKIADLDNYRNLVLIGTAIPESMKDVSKPGDDLPRHDWLFYKRLIEKLPSSMRRPIFGDYTLVHPNFTAFDMRKIKSAGKLVYTTERRWSVRKGGAFRDNPEQMHEHCAHIASSAEFKGAAYSNGDDYIAKCAKREVGPSNQPYWKFVTINHHITHVLDDLAKLGGGA